MNLVIFDIDGTLTRTNEADEACFAKTVKDEFRIHEVSTNWFDYTHSTDSGIIHELVEKKRGHAPTAQELESFKGRFVRHLEKFYQDVPHSFQPVQGSQGLFDKIRQKASQWKVAIATGGWRPSALLKLSKAGLKNDEIPAAYADDHFSRDEIILKAIERAKEAYKVNSVNRVVYVGDGRWDYVSSKRLGISFVGISDNRPKDVLASHGATHILQDYSDFDQFMEYVEQAPKLVAR